jgi:hypothetical protein
MNTQDIDTLEIIDFSEPKLKNRVNIVTGIVALLITMGFATVLQLHGFTTLFILIVVALLIPETVVHEYLHFLFQWHFSREKPHLGFTFPFPYSALSPTSSITRNQAVLSALAPAIVITPILVIPALFATFLLKILLLAWAAIALATCYGDFYLVYRLLRNPSSCRLRNANLTNLIFRAKSQ